MVLVLVFRALSELEEDWTRLICTVASTVIVLYFLINMEKKQDSKAISIKLKDIVGLAGAAECETQRSKEGIPLDAAIHPDRKFEDKPTTKSIAVGVCYVLTIMATSTVLSVTYLLTAAVFVTPFSRQYAVFLMRYGIGKWFSMTSLMQEVLFGVRVRIIVDSDAPDIRLTREDDSLLICNHRSEVDWFYFWNLGVRFNMHSAMRTMLKSQLRLIPGPGWAMTLLRFPFVSRAWEKDAEALRATIEGYRHEGLPICLAMFPEGTALYDRALMSSHKFSEKSGLPKYEYVLQPRFKGFEYVVQHLQPSYIVDATIAYPELMQGVRPSPLRFLMGLFPRDVVIHYRKYRLPEVTQFGQDAKEWLRKRFEAKEQMLKNFYTTGILPGKELVFEPLEDRFIADTLFVLLVLALSLYLMSEFWLMRLYFVCGALYCTLRTLT